MKLAYLITAAFAAVTTTAAAADLPTKAPLMPVPPPFNWTGFYVGPNAGAGLRKRYAKSKIKEDQ